jgi:hypothetical protein
LQNLLRQDHFDERHGDDGRRLFNGAFGSAASPTRIGRVVRKLQKNVERRDHGLIYVTIREISRGVKKTKKNLTHDKWCGGPRL